MAEFEVPPQLFADALSLIARPPGTARQRERRFGVKWGTRGDVCLRASKRGACQCFGVVNRGLDRHLPKTNSICCCPSCSKARSCRETEGHLANVRSSVRGGICTKNVYLFRTCCRRAAAAGTAANASTIVSAAGFVVSGLLSVAVLTLPNGRGGAPAGPVHFAITCGSESQTQFDRATALFHSMEPDGAIREYNAIAKAEPDCAMSYWGIAVSQLHYPVRKRPIEDEDVIARAALAKAVAAPTASPRERAFIEGLDQLFGAADPKTWQERTIAYASAMEKMAAHYPDDVEVNIFYALALGLSVVPGTDDGFARLSKASEILLAVFGEHPDHPGAAHYLTYCLNPLAHRGFASARGLR
jgi:hypothetical protein